MFILFETVINEFTTNVLPYIAIVCIAIFSFLALGYVIPYRRHRVKNSSRIIQRSIGLNVAAAATSILISTALASILIWFTYSKEALDHYLITEIIGIILLGIILALISISLAIENVKDTRSDN